ncbi:bola protein [Lanmaoa asiatica]|nr:bola protein [Lanmaoa asiatica]
MPVQINELEQAIRDAFPILHLQIEDQSSGCGESYAVLLVSEAFEGKTTLARHRLINDTLKAQIAEMHAFSQVRHTCGRLFESNRRSSKKTFTPKQYEAYLAKGQ